MNSSFSTKIPHLQLAWDSTSIGLLKTCARKYYLSIVLSKQAPADSIHLSFGILYHEAHRHFQLMIIQGVDREQAIKETVRLLFKWTWDDTLNRPSTLFSEDSYKNRLTLIRSFVWHCDQYSLDETETVILPSGRPAIELSFRFGTSYSTQEDEQFVLCGHIDRIIRVAGLEMIQDYKTTKYNVDSSDFFSYYSPDNQVSCYSFAGKVVYQLPLQGVMIDAVQVQVGGSRFRRGPIQRTEDQVNEWYEELGYWLTLAEYHARKDSWPMNETACGMYGGCPFRPICGKDRRTRDAFLKVYRDRVWDPLQVRGEM